MNSCESRRLLMAWNHRPSPGLQAGLAVYESTGHRLGDRFLDLPGVVALIRTWVQKYSSGHSHFEDPSRKEKNWHILTLCLLLLLLMMMMMMISNISQKKLYCGFRVGLFHLDQSDRINPPPPKSSQLQFQRLIYSLHHFTICSVNM